MSPANKSVLCHLEDPVIEKRMTFCECFPIFPTYSVYIGGSRTTL